MPYQKSNSHIIAGIIIFLLTLYMAQHCAFIAYHYPEYKLVELLSVAITNSTSHPFDAFSFKEQYWQDTCMLILFIGGIVELLVFVDWLNHKNTHIGKEKGTAKWNTLTKYIREYTYCSRAIAFDKAKKKTDDFFGVKTITVFWYKIYYFHYLHKGLWERAKDTVLEKTGKKASFFATLKEYLLLRGKAAKNDEEPTPNTDAHGNLLFSDEVKFNLDKTSNLNNNVCIVGGPGTGKSRGYVLPNILQHNTSYVVADPSGELIKTVGMSLMKDGYHIKLFNARSGEMRYSCGYNPFRYIRTDEHVLTLVDCLIKNTDDSKAQKGDQFFAKAEQALLSAIFFYLYYFGTPDEKNMAGVMKLLSEAEVNEKDRNYKSALDNRFEEIKRGTGRIKHAEPDHIAVRYYNIFKQGTGKTAMSILISVQVRMGPFNVDSIKRLMYEDTIHLEELGESKQALFISTSTNDTTFNFLSAMMYTQLFQILYQQCEVDNLNTHQLVKGGTLALRSKPFRSKQTEEDTLKAAEIERKRYQEGTIIQEERGNEDAKYTMWLLKDKSGEVLKEFMSEKEKDLFMDALNNGKWVHGNMFTTIPVHVILDEFKNIGEIPAFDQTLSTVRKYHISCTVILQSIDQLKAMYEDNYGTILGDCSTQIFLGSTNQEDLEYFSKAIGSATQTVKNRSTGGGKNSQGDNFSFNQDEYTLMRPEQLRTMPSSDCIVLISGLDPFYCRKYRLERHKRFNETKERFDYHLYFDNSNIEISKMTTIEPKLDIVKKAEAAANSERIPEVCDLVEARKKVQGLPVKSVRPYTEHIEDMADVLGEDKLVEKINKGAATLSENDLSPLIKKPFPPKTLDQNSSASDVAETVIIGPDGYPM